MSAHNENVNESVESKMADTVTNAEPDQTSGREWATSLASTYKKLASGESKKDEIGLCHDTMFSGAGVAALLWGLPETVVAPAELLVDRVARVCMGKKSATKSVDILTADHNILGQLQDDDIAVQHSAAIRAIALAHSLKPLAKYCDSSRWEKVGQTLLEAFEFGARRLGDGILLDQLLCVELPLTIASELSVARQFSALAKPAIKSFKLNEGSIDSDGFPSSDCLPDFGPLVASWARCLELIGERKKKIDPAFRDQLNHVPEQFLRLHNGMNQLMVSRSQTRPSCKEFVEQVLAMSSQDLHRQLAMQTGVLVTPKSKMDSKKQGDKVSPLDDLELTCVSEWGATMALRSKWTRKASRFTIGFGDDPVLLEIGSRCPLISGHSSVSVEIDDVIASCSGEFEVVCELHDYEVSYFEIEMELNNGAATLLRQVLLSREDDFLFCNDVVTTPQPRAKIKCTSRWPLASGIEVMPETETRELYLVREKKIESLVLPLGLPEWKCGRTSSSFEVEQRELVLQQSATVGENGGGLSVPLLFDLNAKRSRRKRTWRQLTVGESLQSVCNTDAVAYRAQLDKKNFVFYLAMSGAANRTFMGENFNGEFFAGRLEKSGLMSQLVRVEA